jgi:hemerythrin-like domain-containing protein
MSRMLKKLRNDHFNLKRLLSIIEIDLQAAEDEQSIDFEIIRSAIEYMINTPDVTHHPMEDLIFGILVDHDRDARHVVENLLGEHRLLKERGVAFLEMLELVGRDEAVLRKDLLKLGHDYLNLLKDHMSEEELVAFPWASRCLTEANWQSVADAFPEVSDPLFGANTSKNFAALYEYLRVGKF